MKKKFISKIGNFRQDRKHPHEVIHWNRRITASPWYKNQSTKHEQQFPKPDQSSLPGASFDAPMV
jgi:hypothetical protein